MRQLRAQEGEGAPGPGLLPGAERRSPQGLWRPPQGQAWAAARDTEMAPTARTPRLFWKSSQLQSRVGDTDGLCAESPPDPAGTGAFPATEEFYFCHILLIFFLQCWYINFFSAEKHNRAVAMSEKKNHNSGKGNS